MTGITDLMLAGGHEQVVFAADRAAGLRAIIAVHSTALGPSLGGVRFWHYPSEHEAAVDVLRLSAAMTAKASVAGLHQGGGKTVVLLDTPGQPHTEAMLRALGRAIDELGGRYLAAEDVGATPGDMDRLALETPWVTGVAEATGGSGDPSPVTAHGVLHAMRAVLRDLHGDPSLAGRRVAVQGAGHVGSHLVALLAAAGADVVLADIDGDRAGVVAETHGATLGAPETILAESCDVLAPCALGAVLSRDTVPRLQCAAVCGGANNQLSDESIAQLLADRGVLYAPDFVANAGGIINIAEEFSGYSRERAMERTAAIEGTMTAVLERAHRTGVTPERAAGNLARERIEREGRAAGGVRVILPRGPAAHRSPPCDHHFVDTVKDLSLRSAPCRATATSRVSNGRSRRCCACTPAAPCTPRSSTRPARRFRSRATHCSERSKTRGPRPWATSPRAAHMDPAVASRQVSQLVDDGLVRRSTSADDARVTLVDVTQRGRDVRRRVGEVLERHMWDVLASWSASDRRRLAQLLERLVDDLRAVRYRPEMAAAQEDNSP